MTNGIRNFTKTKSTKQRLDWTQEAELKGKKRKGEDRKKACQSSNVNWEESSDA